MSRRRISALPAALLLLSLSAPPVVAQAVEQAPGPPDATASPVATETSSVAAPTAAEELAASLLRMLPEEIDGQPLQTSVATGAELLAAAPDRDTVDELVRIADANGGDVAGMALASAGVSNDQALAIVLAASIPGVDAELIGPALRALLLPQSADAAVTQEEIAGRSVTKLTRRGMVVPDDIAYVLASGEVFFILVADRSSLEELIAGLP